MHRQDSTAIPTNATPRRGMPFFGPPSNTKNWGALRLPECCNPNQALEVKLQSKLNVTMLVGSTGDRRHTLLCGNKVEGRDVRVRDLDIVVGVVEHVIHLEPELEVEALGQLEGLRYDRVERPVVRSPVRVTTTHRQSAAGMNSGINRVRTAEDDLVRYLQRVSRSKRLADAGINRKRLVQEVI